MCDSKWNGKDEIINCANAKPGDANPGCSGDPYKIDKLEGTFACLWTKGSIGFYYWTPESDVSKNGGPLSDKPDPSLWTEDYLKNRVELLGTDARCIVNKHQSWQCKNCANSDQCQFYNMKMIFNVTLCGDWAGNQFDSTDNAMNNCRSFIMDEGKRDIDGRYMKLEYVSVNSL